MGPLVLIELVHDFLGTQAKLDFFGLLIDGEDTVFDLFSPEEFIIGEGLHSVVGTDKLADTRESYVC